MADFVPRVGLDEDCPACHPSSAAAVGGANQVSGAAANVNQAAAHFSTHPVACVPLDVDFATGHLAAHVPAGAAEDPNRPNPHVGADPMDSGQITFPDHVSIGRVPFEQKQFGEWEPAISQKNFDSLHFAQALALDRVWYDAFHFDWHTGFGLER
jgi:hypothetical protein